jgi:hypothetical protein
VFTLLVLQRCESIVANRHKFFMIDILLFACRHQILAFINAWATRASDEKRC